MKIPVPNDLTTTHLAIANDYEKVGQSVNGLSQLLDEPIVGMKALINYKKYTDMLEEEYGRPPWAYTTIDYHEKLDQKNRPGNDNDIRIAVRSARRPIDRDGWQ